MVDNRADKKSRWTKTKTASDKPMLLIGEVKNVTQVAAEVSTISNDKKNQSKQCPADARRVST